MITSTGDKNSIVGLKEVKSFTQDYITTVRPVVRIPLSIMGETITFYAVVVDTGRIPPVRNLSELTPDTPYVIMLDKKTTVVKLKRMDTSDKTALTRWGKKSHVY